MSDWPIQIDIPVAWGDMDAFGHVNNTVFFRWFETARIAFFEATGVADRMESDGIGPILASTRCDFKLPVAYPERVRAHTTVTRVGRTSFVMANRVTRGDELVAVGEGVLVMLDYRTGTKVPLPDSLRERIASLCGL